MSFIVFDPAYLQKVVQETIPATLPEGHHSALVGTVDQSGAQVVASFTKDTSKGTWQIEGAIRHTWTGDNAVGAAVIYSF